MIEILTKAKELYDLLKDAETKWTAKVLAFIEFVELLKPLFKQPFGDTADGDLSCYAVTAEEALANLTNYVQSQGEGYAADGKFIKLLAQLLVKFAPLILTIL